jgi:hypothetical protein
MRTGLSSILLLILCILSKGTPDDEQFTVANGPQNLEFSYEVETHLTAVEFSDLFRERLITKYSWHELTPTIEDEGTYRSLFNFDDESKHSWICEIKIKKTDIGINMISVEMNMTPKIES